MALINLKALTARLTVNLNMNLKVLTVRLVVNLNVFNLNPQ